MHEITWESIGFYAAVYAIAFASTIVRTVRNPDGLDWRNTLSLGATSGFLAFGIVCFLVDRSTDSGVRPWYYLGGAALLGMLAKEQDAIAKLALKRFWLAGKTVFEDTDSGPRQ